LLFLERVTTNLGRDRALAFSYLPIAFRQSITGLFLIDGAMGDVVRTTQEPMVGEIRLAWWRERLEELDEGVLAPAEPRLQDVERYVLPRVTGHDVAELEPGWLKLFAPFPWTEETSEAIWLRGNRLFGLAARLLDQPDEHLQSAGGLWALVDVARHCSDGPSRALLLKQALGFARGLSGTRFQRRLRPLSMLASLAIADCRRGEPFEPEGTPRRVAAMIRHRITGRLPR
jgi:phytoene synthase